MKSQIEKSIKQLRKQLKLSCSEEEVKKLREELRKLKKLRQSEIKS